MSTKSDFCRRWGRASRAGIGVPREPGDPGRAAGGQSRPERGARLPGGWAWGGGKTFLLPGDDVKTPGLAEENGLGENGGHAGAGGWEWGWGVRKGGESQGLGAGKGRSSPPPHTPKPPIPTYRGKALPARYLLRG